MAENWQWDMVSVGLENQRVGGMGERTAGPVWSTWGGFLVWKVICWKKVEKNFPG